LPCLVKIIGALTAQREEALIKRKEDHEDLMHSIFPKVVADELIAKQSEESPGGSAPIVSQSLVLISPSLVDPSSHLRLILSYLILGSPRHRFRIRASGA